MESPNDGHRDDPREDRSHRSDYRELIAQENLLIDALGAAHVAESAGASLDLPGRIPQQTISAGNALVERSEAVEDALTEVRAEITRRPAR